MCTQMDKKPTKMEKALSLMMNVFMDKLEDTDKLTKTQFKELLKEEMPTLSEVTGDCGDDVFKDVDLDKDGAVDFLEFSMVVARYVSTHMGLIGEILKLFAEDEPVIAVCPPADQQNIAVCPPACELPRQVCQTAGPLPCVLKRK